MSNKLTGEGMARFAREKLATPYFYGSKLQYGVLTENFMKDMHRSYPSVVTLLYMVKARRKKNVGRVNVDCSGLIYGYRRKNVCSAQLYSTAKKRLPINHVNDFAIGTVLWKEGHVSIYIGKENGVPMCIEAKGINYGTVKTKVSQTAWKCGLTFDDMEYTYEVKVSGSSKGKNPYGEPCVLLKKGSKGESVKWLQWELVESGYTIKVDGDLGKNTLAALKKFQKSAKIKVDGICGQDTRKRLKVQ